MKPAVAVATGWITRLYGPLRSPLSLPRVLPALVFGRLG